MTYKTYSKQRYIFFWLSVIVYFVPYIVATAFLIPPMSAARSMKWSIGLSVVLLNTLPFIGGMFRRILSHFPFVNLPAILFVLLAGFFLLDIFRSYVYTFLTIEATAAAGSVAACFMWHLHRKYKRQARTVKTVIKSGVLALGGA